MEVAEYHAFSGLSPRFRRAMLGRRESAVMADFDLAIIGGGINGAGIARDAAGRGLSRAARRAERPRVRHLVGLHQAHPWRLALSRTRLVPAGARSAGRARSGAADGAASGPADALRAAASNPACGRPGMLRLGLFLYDHLGGRRILPATRAIDLARDPLGAPLKGRYRTGFEYSDCQADNSRLVVLNALDAAERGAVIRTRTRCVRAERGEVWQLTLEARGRRDVVSARALVNATGPWVGAVEETVLQRRAVAAASPRQGQPHRGAAAVRSRPRLYFPEHRRPRRVRAAVRARLHAGRHHRPRISRAIRRQPRRRRTKSTISATCVNDHFRTDDCAGRCALVVRRRALALRRRLDKAAGHAARLCSCAR